MRNVIILLTFVHLFCAFGNEGDLPKKEYQFFKGSTTFIKNPFKLRDPFKRNVSSRHLQKSKKKSTFFTGALNNEPSLDGVDINRIRIVGVLLGKDRRAIAKVADVDDQTYILREGMSLGADGAEIRAILPGGIVLVEKIRNVYDQDEYLETVIPISDE